MSALKIITTSDGSHSLLNTQLNETYHSVHGARQESMHVFIENGLQYFAESTSPAEISVLEVGFGTGLNALLALEAASSLKILVRYTTLESHPLEPMIWKQLNFASADQSRNFEVLHEAAWASEKFVHDHFCLLKINQTLQEVKFSQNYDVIFFDAFAPSKQPEMWELPMLRKVVERMTANAVFVTYCAKGQLKRDLRDLGLNVQTLAGPPGKKEMVRALKNY
jgi:tRNA U34 5-methylaminomethyl-2-thiouridine-forming methyltransferase MnmC